MNNIAILLTDSKSINEQLLLISLKNLKNAKLKKIYLIGDSQLFRRIYASTKKIKKIIFIDIKKKTEFNYLKKITEFAINLHVKNKIKFLINLPLNKKKFLKNQYNGFTEFFSKLVDNKKNENMLMFSNSFSVCPITTHIELKNVEKNINKKKIYNAILNINNFFLKIIKKKISIVLLGLNPHASKDLIGKTKDIKIIEDIKKTNKQKNIIGPLSADTAFNNCCNKVFIGMYHDQVLIPFKMKNEFNGINITIGKKLIRLSPDHGTGEKIINKPKLINNKSFLECIKFCEKY